MGTGTMIPLSEYLGHSFRPDCDYVDGELEERNLGEEDHSDLQSQILEILRNPANKQFIRANTELRVQVKANRYRVPDVCVRRRDCPKEQVVRTPPLLCVEVLSPEDRVSRTRERIGDFLEMGVLEVWVVDAELRTVTVYTGKGIEEHAAGSLTVPGTPVTIQLAEVFSALDEYD